MRQYDQNQQVFSRVMLGIGMILIGVLSSQGKGLDQETGNDPAPYFFPPSKSIGTTTSIHGEGGRSPATGEYTVFPIPFRGGPGILVSPISLASKHEVVGLFKLPSGLLLNPGNHRVVYTIMDHEGVDGWLPGDQLIVDSNERFLRCDSVHVIHRRGVS